MVFGVDPDVSARVTERVLKNTDKPVIMKLTPNVTDIRVIARAVESAGAHAISLINTLTGMAIDVDSRTPKLANIYGGLSGPAIRPVAVFMVYQAASSVKIPVIGMGGIMDGRDALEFLIAGASAVQVGTANFVNPAATLDVLDGIRGYCEKHGVRRIQEIVGTMRTHSVGTME
jgi:dihydroorotate dehydrogenase (NAD+) catalytic subunit